MRPFGPTLGVASACVLVATSTLAFATPDLTTQATAGATSLGMDGRGNASTHIFKIAELSISTSSASGFLLSVSSGNLAKGDGSTPVHVQVAVVDHDAAAPSSAAFTSPSGMTYTFATTHSGAVQKDLYIKYTPAALQDPGTYSASVDLGVVDN
jgi:hypothetical protein